MMTDHAHLIALNRFTGELLWDTHARRLAQELRGVVGAAAGRQPRDLRRVRRRARRERVRRGARSGDRQGGLAVLDGAEARRAGIRDVEGQGHRARRRADVVHRQLRSRRSTSSTGRPAIPSQGIQRRRPQGRQPLRRLHPRARSQDRQAEVVLPVHAARSVGLGRDADVGAHRRRLAGTAAQADAARQPQRVLLRVRSARTASCCWRSRS